MLKDLNKNKIILTIIILIVVLAIPLTILQVQQQQEIRQRAEGQPQPTTVYLRFIPFDNALNPTGIGETFDIDLQLINSGTLDISSLEIAIPPSFKDKDGNDIFSVEKFEPKPFSDFETIVNEYDPNYGLRYVGANLNPGPIAKQDIVLGKLTIKASKEGVVAVNPNTSPFSITSPSISGYVNFQLPHPKYSTSTYRSAASTTAPSAPTPISEALPPAAPETRSLSGTIYLVDANGNKSVFNPQEKRIEMYVVLYRLDKNPVNDKRFTIKVSSDGKYSFKDLKVGSYQLFFRVPDGYKPTQPLSNLIHIRIVEDGIFYDTGILPPGFPPPSTIELKGSSTIIKNVNFEMTPL